MTDLLKPPPDSASGSSPFEPDETQKSGLGIVPLLAIVGLLAMVGVRWPWALLVVGLLVLSIFLHEMGHFLAAKQAGMKVTEYFIGFGPRLWSFRRGETEYGLKAIPAGAYVRIVGMSDLEDVETGDEGRTYREKGYWKRLRVVLAGPAMNFLIAFALILAVAAIYGEARPDHWTVREVTPGSAAAAAGLQSGDRVVSIAGESIGDFDSVSDVIHRNAGQPIDLVVERDGSRQTLHATPGWALDDAAAAALSPLQAGDRIKSINGKAVTSYLEVAQFFGTAPAGTATVTFERGSHTYEAGGVVTPTALPADGARGFLGISETVPNEHVGPLTAVTSAAGRFKDLAVTSVQGAGKMLSPSGFHRYVDLVFSTGPKDTAQQRAERAQQEAGIKPVDTGAPPVQLSGATSADESRFVSIVGIVGVGSQLGQIGLIAVLLLFASVNFFLGLLNLLPLPPFDGGHAAVATYEAIRGRIAGRPYRADMAKLLPVAYGVIGLLAFVGLSSVYLDLVDPIKISP